MYISKYHIHNENNQSNYLEMFEKRITEELIQLVDGVEKKKPKVAPYDRIIIQKPNYSNYLIDKYISFESTYQEIPCRSIILGNIPQGTTKSDIIYILGHFGDYECINFDYLNHGKVTVMFYNLNDSMLMRISNIYIQSKKIILSFGEEHPIVNKKHPPNNGTLVLFNLPNNVSNDKIYSLFSGFGQIRDIRNTPNKYSQRFIEFYDLRDALMAKNKMKYKKLNINGQFCQINVEFSLPGNYRSNYNQHYNHNIPTIEKRVSN